MEVTAATLEHLQRAGADGALTLYQIDSACIPKLSQYATAELSALVDCLGTASAKDQGLASVVTTWAKLADSDHTLFLVCSSLPQLPAAAASGAEASAGAAASCTAVGFMKVGTKHLFLYKGSDYTELDAQCCLDVFVHGTQQRKGVGACMFRLVCSALQLDHPGRLAFDRPSSKMKPFLRKHFGLGSEEEQPNRFLVFHCFWGGEPPSPLHPPAASAALAAST